METFHCISHVESTSETKTKIFKRGLDFLKETIHTFAFLETDDNIRSLFFNSFFNEKHIKIMRTSSLKVSESNHDTIILLGGTTTRRTTLNFKNSVEYVFASLSQITDFSIRMHTKHLRRFNWQLLFNVFLVCFIIELAWIR